MMAEFLVIFGVTCVVLCLLALAMYFGRPPVYRISRLEALALLNDLMAGRLTELKWLVFIGHAIPSDPELDEIRSQCNQIELAAEQGQKVAFSISAKRYDEAGQIQLRYVVLKLEKLIGEAPTYREF
ncbi:MAG: hypothetical protein HRU06_05650 [Oceanospirillaceae bacterium]|nr:hypothetical protein [Oceanospirillaceae bacterium]